MLLHYSEPKQYGGSRLLLSGGVIEMKFRTVGPFYLAGMVEAGASSSPLRLRQRDQFGMRATEAERAQNHQLAVTVSGDSRLS